jgi:hypothetical protein
MGFPVQIIFSGNLIWGRVPAYIPDYCRELIVVLSGKDQRQGHQLTLPLSFFAVFQILIS